MSTYWGYHCKTDDQYSEHWINHGDEILCGLAKAYPHLVEARKFDRAGYFEFALMGFGTAPFGWLEEHDGHEIELSADYGGLTPICA